MSTAELDGNGQPLNRRLSMARNATRDANELTGLVRGVLADGALNQVEAEFLQAWLLERPETQCVWPFDVLLERIDGALSDGHLDADEERELMELLLDFTGGGSGGRVASNASSLPLCTSPPDVLFEDANFVLTGTFVTGTRKECEKIIVERGGSASKNCSKKTNYLVIGEVGSTDWANTTYGRKIEHGVALRSKGSPISIISEQHWSRFL